MGSKYVRAVAIAAIFIVLQVGPAQSLFQMFQTPGTKFVQPAEPRFQEQPHVHGHHHGVGIQSSPALANLPMQFSGLHMIGNVKSLASTMQSKIQMPKVHLNIQMPKNVQSFYEECGRAERHCFWDNTAPPAQNTRMNLNGETQEEEQATEMKRSCYLTKHTCVGNTESCISERNCVAGMKITEAWKEGSKKSHIISVSSLNGCESGPQSVSDIAKADQVFLGVGFATFNEAGQAVECRAPKASDFKLVFLWKNSTEGFSGNSSCKVPSAWDFKAVKGYDAELMKTVQMWPKICNTLENKEGGFNLKSFLTNNIPNSHYTPYFSAPFDFADNLEPQFSSNGMVVTGAISVSP